MIARVCVSVSVRVNESVCMCCWIGSADVPLKTTKPSQTLQSQRDGRKLLASEICLAKRWQARSSDKQGWRISSWNPVSHWKALVLVFDSHERFHATWDYCRNISGTPSVNLYLHVFAEFVQSFGQSTWILKGRAFSNTTASHRSRHGHVTVMWRSHVAKLVSVSLALVTHWWDESETSWPQVSDINLRQLRQPNSRTSGLPVFRINVDFEVVPAYAIGDLNGQIGQTPNLLRSPLEKKVCVCGCLIPTKVLNLG